MNEQNIKEILKIVLDSLQGKEFIWRLEGSANLKIQSIDVSVRDLDITTNEEGIEIECDNPDVPTDEQNICYKIGLIVVDLYRLEKVGFETRHILTTILLCSFSGNLSQNCPVSLYQVSLHVTRKRSHPA